MNISQNALKSHLKKSIGSSKVVIANGGLGGGPTNNWLGAYGQARFIRLDMKLLADIGLVIIVLIILYCKKFTIASFFG